ncbi:CPBP family intramembrane glutamic endopeptidase [Microtetraspora fusca]|uniref:CPBP family intramembrane glutamic endopeptidase n=1 Tax=Microtetraspora fusca TaxID=1997 RepID=UPI0008371B78|nr:CPBP family intramembrane glutamic endopeptidase [Microtetraspora fusca]
MIPTPIPDTRAYALTALALLSLSCLTLAAHLHTRWAWVRRLPLLAVHVLLMSALVLAGAALLGPMALLQPVPEHPAGWWGLPSGALVGFALGLLIIRVDRAITTSWRRSSTPPARPQPPRMTAARPAGFAASGTGLSERRRTGLVRARNDYAPTRSDLQVRLELLVAVAVGEELVFRGLLTRLALLLADGPLVVAGLAVAAAVFACSHVFFGWVQVLAKIPLAVAACAATLLTGNVLAAIVCHVVFNVWVWRYRRSEPVARRVPARGMWGATA